MLDYKVHMKKLFIPLGRWKTGIGNYIRLIFCGQFSMGVRVCVCV